MAAEMRATFAALLKRYRQEVGLTQEELAERARISVRAVSALEQGINRWPRKDTVALLAAALTLSAPDRAAFETAARRSSRGPAEPSARRGDIPPLVGREQEVALLRRHLAGDGPPVLLVAGEPGIGKSRLLDEACGLAGTARMAVLQGGCQRREDHEPYAPLLGALKGHIDRQTPARQRADLRGCAWLVRLLPELALAPIEPLPSWTLPPAHERRLIRDAVARFLANVAGPAGTVLLLDDLQWADGDALDMLASLARSAAATPLRVVAAYRDTELSPQHPLSLVLADLSHAGLIARHALTPLATADAAALFDSTVGDLEAVEPGLRVRMMERAAGVPFFVMSCAQGLRLAVETGSGEATIPWTLAQSVRQRVIALEPAARDVLAAAAVIGRAVQIPLLLATTAHPEGDISAALDAAGHARLLVEQPEPGGYWFAHDVIREVVEADLGPARRMALHRRVAEALEGDELLVEGTAERRIERLAYHYSRSAAQHKALLYLERAGDGAAARAAHDAALAYYQQWIERADGLGSVREGARGRERLAAVLSTWAKYDEAIAALESAAEVYRAAGELDDVARVTATLGQVHADRGTPEQGVAVLRPLADDLSGADPSHGLAALLVALGHLYFASGRYAELLDADRRAEEVARAIGDERVLAEALFGQGLALLKIGHIGEGLRSLEDAIPLAERAEHLYVLCWALYNVALVYRMGGRFAASKPYTERACTVAERQGNPMLIAVTIGGRGLISFFLGDWARARADDERAVAISRQAGGAWGTAYPLFQLGALCLAEGAWDEAARLLQECVTVAERSNDLQALRLAHGALAELDIALGRPEAAIERLAPLLDRDGAQEHDVDGLLPILAWAYLDGGDIARAEETARLAVERVRASGQNVTLSEALRVHALVAMRGQCWDDAAGSIEEGLTLVRGMPFPYGEARLLHLSGALHAHQDPLDAVARERLRAALAIFERLGARKAVERARRDIAADHHDLYAASGTVSPA